MIECIGAVSFSTQVDSSTLAVRIADALLREQASDVRIAGDRVTFSVAAFRFVSSWNVLGPFTSGELVIDRNFAVVLYLLSIRRLVYTAALTPLVMIGFLVFASRSWIPVLFAPVFSAWLFGGNLLIGLPRFRSFLARAVAMAAAVRR